MFVPLAILQRTALGHRVFLELTAFTELCSLDPIIFEVAYRLGNGFSLLAVGGLRGGRKQQNNYNKENKLEQDGWFMSLLPVRSTRIVWSVKTKVQPLENSSPLSF